MTPLYWWIKIILTWWAQIALTLLSNDGPGATGGGGSW